MNGPLSRFPERVVNVHAARQAHGGLIDRLAPALSRTDPAADEAIRVLAALAGGAHRVLDKAIDGDANTPAEVRAMVEEAQAIPVWADERRLARAGELLFRTGVYGGIALGAKSLLIGYTSPAGNKPLIWSGRLQTNASRRLAETAKFVSAVAEPGGLLPGGEGFRIALRVRLIHAQVRDLIHRRGGWPMAQWGLPINQHDMLATILLFANEWLSGIEDLGISVSSEEAEDYMHLWRLAGHILGVEHDLLPATRAEGERYSEVIRSTQGPPDEDSRDLVQAYLHHPLEAAKTEAARRAMAFRLRVSIGIVRGLLGEEMSDQLQLPKDGWRFVVPAVREAVRRTERVRLRLPGGRRRAIDAGRQHWARIIELGLDGLSADFDLPLTLAGRFESPALA